MRLIMPVLAGCALALSACATRPAQQPAPASAFNAIAPLPEQLFASPDEVIAHYLAPVGRAFPTTREIRRDQNRPGTALLLFSAEGYEDDSVSGEQWRVALVQDEAGYRVTEAGNRHKCYRPPSGVMAGEWTRQPCR